MPQGWEPAGPTPTQTAAAGDPDPDRRGAGGQRPHGQRPRPAHDGLLGRASNRMSRLTNADAVGVVSGSQMAGSAPVTFITDQSLRSGPAPDRSAHPAGPGPYGRHRPRVGNQLAVDPYLVTLGPDTPARPGPRPSSPRRQRPATWPRRPARPRGGPAGVASTDTSRLPRATVVSASVTVYRNAAARPAPAS
jgi:hypothetical protein